MQVRTMQAPPSRLRSILRTVGLPWPEGIAFLLYCSVVAFTLPHHEAWADEAEAWLIARDCSFWQILHHQIHYENSPPLWHLLLRVEVLLGVSYTGMHWLAAAFTAASVFLLLRCDFLPRFVRVLLPFTAAFLYHGPVIPRSYTLLPLLLLMLALSMRSVQPRPAVQALLIGLLANTSVFGGLLSAGFLLQSMVARQDRRAFVWNRRSLAVLLPLLLLAGYCLIPATDASFHAPAVVRNRPAVTRVVGWLTGSPTFIDKVQPIVIARPSAVVAMQVLPAPGTNRLQRWVVAHRFLHGQGRLARLGWRAFRIAEVNLFCISGSNLLAVAFLIALATWLYRMERLAAALPFALLATVAPLMPIGGHHVLIWWFILTALLCATWPTERQLLSSRTHAVFCFLLVAVLLQQVAYGVHAVRFDIKQPFDGGRAAYEFLQPDRPGTTIAGSLLFTTSLEPYAPRNIFLNRPTSYQPWSIQYDDLQMLNYVGQQHPRFVLRGRTASFDRLFDQQIAPVLLIDQNVPEASMLALGYQRTHSFCGAQPMHMGVEMTICQDIYEPVR